MFCTSLEFSQFVYWPFGKVNFQFLFQTKNYTWDEEKKEWIRKENSALDDDTIAEYQAHYGEQFIKEYDQIYGEIFVRYLQKFDFKNFEKQPVS